MSIDEIDNTWTVPAEALVGMCGPQAMIEGKWRYVLKAELYGDQVTVEFGDSGGTVEIRYSYYPKQLLSVRNWDERDFQK